MAARVAAWLPVLEDGVAPWQDGLATRTRTIDDFGRLVRFGPIDPKHWTRVTRWDRRVPGAIAVYDPAHRIVMYEAGCCTYQEIVLATGVGPPPHPIATANLASVRTSYGIRLGDSIAQVRGVYGFARQQPVPGKPSWRALRYYRKFETDRCVDAQNLYFVRRRLVAIAYWHGC